MSSSCGQAGSVVAASAGLDVVEHHLINPSRPEMAGFSGEIERLRSGQAVGKLQSRIKELEQQVGMGNLLPPGALQRLHRSTSGSHMAISRHEHLK